MRIQLKRIYETSAHDDGLRILVDRLWPRGVTKIAAHVDLWLKDIAPSPALRTWYGHDPARWDEFKRRYFAELEQRDAAVAELRDLAATQAVTFVYAAKDTAHTHALALKEFIERARGPAKKITKTPPAAPRRGGPRR